MATDTSDSHFPSKKNGLLTINIWQNPIYFIAFGFGSGKLPAAPGTWGTVAAIPLYLLVQDFSLIPYLLILTIATVFGIWICDVTEKAIGIHDYSGIVWDEVCGYGLTMLAAPKGWIWILLGFLLFRFFDILKPWPTNWMDRAIPGGFGVVIDDLGAAVYALLGMQILAHFF